MLSRAQLWDFLNHWSDLWLMTHSTFNIMRILRVKFRNFRFKAKSNNLSPCIFTSKAAAGIRCPASSSFSTHYEMTGADSHFVSQHRSRGACHLPAEQIKLFRIPDRGRSGCLGEALDICMDTRQGGVYTHALHICSRDK